MCRTTVWAWLGILLGLAALGQAIAGEDWPQWRGPQRDGVWRETGQIDGFEIPNWGVAAAPLIEGDLLNVQIGGEDGACVVGMDKRTGEPRWTAVDDGASYCAPTAVDQAGRRVVICRTAGQVVGLVPESGEVLWSYAHPWERWPIAIATPVVAGDLLLLSDAHTGSLLLSLNSTPYIDGDYIYGADGDGMLRCLDLITGLQVWEDRSAVPQNRRATVHLVRQGERTWFFNERGELILVRLTPEGFEEFSRAQLLEPTTDQLRRRDGVTWSHPAFAYGHVFNRNDVALVCADLRSEP